MVNREALADAIRAGAAMVGGRKAVGDYFKVNFNGQFCACAVGCALLGGGHVTMEQAREYVRFKAYDTSPKADEEDSWAKRYPYLWDGLIAMDRAYGLEDAAYRDAIVDMSDHSDRSLLEVASDVEHQDWA